MLDLFGNEIIERAAGSNKIFTCLAASNHSGGGTDSQKIIMQRNQKPCRNFLRLKNSVTQF